ncbi:tetratricopeptide repeat protein [Novosphingobium sp.]|uniref:tetratricopeptide repeat protein n=1 Tax=Novosphingobium sp. TaxID=1874826 RepID=UPI0033426C60
MSLLLPLMMLMQVGPDPHVYPQTPLPAITQHRKDTTPPPPVTAPIAAPVLSDQMTACLTQGRRDADAGLVFARDWLARASAPEERAQPDQCLGLILSDRGDFAGAQAAFADAVAATPPSAPAKAVPLMAMAGNAALARGDGAAALDWFNRALAVRDFADAPARGAILADRAQAQVALGHYGDAAASLADARRAAPSDPAVWLLSATLARREQDLASAQGYIQTAAELNPRDPAIGVEAGVIAVLSGHDAAARKSWNSVVAVAPNSAEAQTARGYLAQLGLAPATVQASVPATMPLDHPSPPPTSPVGR